MKLISASLIVKNELRNLPNLIDDLSKFCDEIVVIDTGSTDGTYEWLLSCGNPKLVVDLFEWIDDFSAARNYSLSKTSYNWVFWCDADDRISPELIQTILDFKSNEEECQGAWINYLFSPGLYVPRVRIASKLQNPKWIGRVHEYLTFPSTNLIDLLDHESYGAIIHNRTHEITDRNLRILQKQIDEGDPMTLRDWIYYGHELYYNEKHKEAYEIYSKYIDKVPIYDQYAMINNSYQMLECGSITPTQLRDLINLPSGNLPMRRSDILYFIARSYELDDNVSEAINYATKALKVHETQELDSLSKYFYFDENGYDRPLELLSIYGTVPMHQ